MVRHLRRMWFGGGATSLTSGLVREVGEDNGSLGRYIADYFESKFFK